MGRNGHARQARVGAEFAECRQVGRVAAVHIAAEVPHGNEAAAEVLHVGVGRVFHRRWLDQRAGLAATRWVFDALPQRLACGQFFLQAIGHDPAVAVLHAATLKTHGVQHAVAVKPVVAARRSKAAVRAGAHVQAVQVGGHFAFDFQRIGDDAFAVHRSKGAVQRWHIVDKFSMAHGSAPSRHHIASV